MRITLMGQAAFGEKVLEALLKRGEEVVGVYAPPDQPGRPDSLAQAARKAGLPLFQPRRLRDAEVYQGYAELRPDLGLMAFVTDIVPESLLRSPRLGTIQYHPSLLPRHRGGSAINWAIIQGEARTGLTIFWPDKGIDTGPILLQKEVEVSPEDTVGSLYFNQLFPLGVEALMEALELVKQGRAPRIPQDESRATYEGLCQEKDGLVDWSQPVEKVYNLIRGTDPQPGATTFWNGEKLKLFGPRRADLSGPPGTILALGEQGMVVAGGEGAILLQRVQPQGAAKVAAADYARQAGLRVGERLGQ